MRTDHRILIIGSGGREHALAWALTGSPLVTKLFAAPGNGGMAEIAECLPLDPMDAEGVIAACHAHAISFVLVGPEAPLCAGLVDALEAAGIAAFGPASAAARLEGSKAFMKDFCTRHGIPTAAYIRTQSSEEAKAFIHDRGAPIVVKTDGLAAGKGVIVAETLAEALAAVDELKSAAFGQAGAELVIEEFLDGEELSAFALCDGETALWFGSAQDHKRVYDGDKGPNTGGMGAYSPARMMTPALEAEIMDHIIRPTLAGMKADGAPFKGVLFAGLMMTKAGVKLLEFNVRFGDPECQTLMLRLKSDLLPALLAARDGQLRHFDLRWRDEAALCVVMAAKGYPGAYAKGTVIENLPLTAEQESAVLFHAGTRREADGRITAQGGRVLNLCALGADVKAAQANAYAAVDRIHWPGGFCRRDIGWRAIQGDKP